MQISFNIEKSEDFPNQDFKVLFNEMHYNALQRQTSGLMLHIPYFLFLLGWSFTSD